MTKDSEHLSMFGGEFVAYDAYLPGNSAFVSGNPDFIIFRAAFD